MLVLSRKESQRIRLGDSIVITIVKISGDKVRVGVDAPSDVLVLRDELEPHAAALAPGMREARQELTAAPDVWPAGYKTRALVATQDAINSVKAILGVTDLPGFRGVERTPDFYKKTPVYPHLRAALGDLR